MISTGSLYELIAAFALAVLAGRVLIEDIRHLSINASLVLALTIGQIIFAMIWPLQGLQPGHAMAGAACGLSLAVMTRAYTHLRTGVPAFGGADIALICGSGALLGPFLLGPWIFLSAMTALLLSRLMPALGVRSESVDDEELAVLPFCPALILCAGSLFLLARTGLLPAQGLL